MSEATLFLPAFLGTLPEFEHHLEHSVPAEAALGAFRAMPDGGECALDWI